MMNWHETHPKNDFLLVLDQEYWSASWPRGKALRSQEQEPRRRLQAMSGWEAWEMKLNIGMKRSALFEEGTITERFGAET